MRGVRILAAAGARNSPPVMAATCPGVNSQKYVLMYALKFVLIPAPIAANSPARNKTKKFRLDNVSFNSEKIEVIVLLVLIAAFGKKGMYRCNEADERIIDRNMTTEPVME